MTTLTEIENRINELKVELKNIEGTKTEVYARIVGYYRSIQNWNKGKKVEFFERKTYNPENFSPRLFERNGLEETVSKNTKQSKLTEECSQYYYFFKKQCPQCPPVSRLIDQIPMPGNKIDAESDEGQNLASKFLIQSTPTVLFLNDENREIFRITSAGELKTLLDNAPATANC